MRKIDKLSESCSLKRAANRLSLTLEEEMSIKDILQFCIDDYLYLSVILRDQEAAERWQYCPLANSFEYINRAYLNFLPRSEYEDCLEYFGSDYLEAFDVLDEKNSESLLSELLIRRELIPSYELPDLKKMAQIKHLARLMFDSNKKDLAGNFCLLPERVYGNVEKYSGRKWLSLRRGYRPAVLNGVFQIQMDKITKEKILDKMIIGDDLRGLENTAHEINVFDKNDDKYTLVSKLKEEPRRPCIQDISYSGLEASLPSVETLVIQKKHLIEFEAKYVEEQQLKLTKKKEPRQKRQEQALRKLIDERGEDVLKQLGRIGIWNLLSDIDSRLFPHREKADSMVSGFFRKAKMIYIRDR